VDPVVKAEKEINFILANLESETGALVEEINLQSLDITSIGSTKQLLQRSVKIELKPVPGTRWDI